MPNTDIEEIKKELVDINTFVQDRFDPVANDVSLLKEESERLGGEVLRLQERERTVRREALARHVEESEKPVVPEGPYSDMDPLDLACCAGWRGPSGESLTGPPGSSGRKRRSGRWPRASLLREYRTPVWPRREG